MGKTPYCIEGVARNITSEVKQRAIPALRTLGNIASSFEEDVISEALKTAGVMEGLAELFDKSSCQTVLIISLPYLPFT
jgi:hypothetical protein